MTSSAPLGQVCCRPSHLQIIQRALSKGSHSCVAALTGGGRDILVSPPSRAAAPLDRQMASPVMAKADMRRHITPKRTPSKKVVKRHKKHDFDSGVLPSCPLQHPLSHELSTKCSVKLL